MINNNLSGIYFKLVALQKRSVMADSVAVPPVLALMLHHPILKSMCIIRVMDIPSTVHGVHLCKQICDLESSNTSMRNPSHGSWNWQLFCVKQVNELVSTLRILFRFLGFFISRLCCSCIQNSWQCPPR